MNLKQITLARDIFTVAFVIESLVVDRINKKRFKHNLELGRELEEENTQLRADLAASYERSTYLIQKLVDNKVPCDEYDFIVLNSLI